MLFACSGSTKPCPPASRSAPSVFLTVRLRHQLREYFPAALAAFEDLDAPEALELLGREPDLARARS